MAFSAWIVWYGLKIGLTYERSLYMPVGELLDLIAIEQIKNEKAKMKVVETEEDFWRQMSYE